VTRVLVLGGARSGKSGFAESLLAGVLDVEYVATGVSSSDDAEWAQRIAAHRARRPNGWTVTETGDVAAVLSVDGPPVLVDSITAWLARTMDDCACWDAAELPADYIERAALLCSQWARTSRRVVVVSDEVGLGVVPDTNAGRLFRDELGALNQRLAAAADEVHLVVAGIPLRLR
jgi:adenosylcobinamide kinase/adenosylcobinamide-phosphate guanylyltransferase